MPADVSSSLKNWSTTAGSNAPTGSTAISTNLDDNLRQIQATVRDVWSRTTVASATTTDIGAVDHGSMNISGTTTITSFGIVSAGIRKWLTFEGALTLTHNGTSLILPSAANITTAAGDVACMESLGSGNWRCLSYMRASGNNVLNASTFSDGTVSAPGIAFSSDTNTGFYRSGADSIAGVIGGVEFLTATTSAGSGTTLSAITGPMRITAGDNGGVGYDITVQPKTTTVPGDAILRGGIGNSSSAGGAALVQGGENTSSGAGGNVVIKPGEASGSLYGHVELWGRGLGGQVVLRINGRTNNAEFVSQGAGDPFITSGGGTSPTISGSNNAFKITLGSSPGTTAIVVTFGGAGFPGAAPVAIAQYQSDHIALRAVATATTVTITPAASMTAGHVIDVFVIGKAAS